MVSQSEATCIRISERRRGSCAALAAWVRTAATRSCAPSRLPISVSRSRAVTSVGSSGTRRDKAPSAPASSERRSSLQRRDPPEQLALQVVGLRAFQPDLEDPHEVAHFFTRVVNRLQHLGRAHAQAADVEDALYEQARLLIADVEPQHLFQMAERARRVVQLVEVDLPEPDLEGDGVAACDEVCSRCSSSPASFS